MKKKIGPLFKHQVLIIFIAVFVIVMSCFSVSFALFSKTKDGDEYNVVKVGKLELSYVDLSEEGNTLQLVSNYPISDNEGRQGVAYRFSVENTGTLVANYSVKIVNDDSVIESDGCGNNLIDASYLRYAFDNDDVNSLNNKLSDTGLYYGIYSGTLQPYESDIHEIRIWLDESSPNSVLGKHYHGKVVIDIVQGANSNPNEAPLEEVVETVDNGSENLDDINTVTNSNMVVVDSNQ